LVLNSIAASSQNQKRRGQIWRCQSQ
jgi:hypothetical protein